MTTDTGKHSALRQTSDGSFEIVYETGEVQPVHEEESSFAETASADVQRLIARPPSRRTLVMVAVGAVALLATIAIVGIVVSDSGRASLESGEELPLVPGFKPYGGGRADSNAAPNRQRNRPAAARAAAAAAERDELDETEEEIVENELGWVVEEELPPEEVMEEEIVEEAVLDEEIVDEAPAASPSNEPVDPRMLRAPRDLAPKVLQRPIGADRIPSPGLPRVGAQGGVYQDRLNRLPVRQIQGDEQADEGALDEIPPEDLAADDSMEGEVVEDEYIEEEVIEEEVVEDY